MRAATTRTDLRPRRSNALVKAAVGSALLTALIAAPAYAGGTPNAYGKARTSTAAVPSNPGGSRWVATDPVAFTHNLTGADYAYELISEVPELEIPFPGVWEITYNARSYVDASTNRSALYVSTQLFKNGTTLIPESAALTGINTTNHAAQTTVGQTVLQKFDKGDKVRLYAARAGQSGTAAILSYSDGRTGITAHWVDPGF